MIKVNEYFGGAVKSLALTTNEGPVTVGVIKVGEYEFGTDTIEIMTVIAGSMDALLPNETAWKTYKQFEAFEVAKGVKFKVRCSNDVAYRCEYK